MKDGYTLRHRIFLDRSAGRLGTVLLAAACLNCLLPSGGLTAEPSKNEPLVIEQQRLAQQFEHLQEVLLRMSELTAATDPRRAALLKKAVAQSKDKLVDVQFAKLVDLLKEDRLSRAIENQENVTKDLNTLLELLLSENRADRIQSEKARIRKYLKQLNNIIKTQKGIQGRSAGTGDAQRLAGEQGELADKTGGLAKDLQEGEDSDATPGKAGSPSGDKSAEGKQGDAKQEEPRGKDANSPNEPNDANPADKGDDGEKGRPNDGGPAPSGQPGEGQTPNDDEGQNPGGSQNQGSPPGQDQGGNPSSPPGQSQQQGEPSARQRIEAAQQRMREAQQKLDQAEREGAVEKQEEAIRQLEQAKADLEKILRQLREEEIERMLTALQQRFRRMLDMQQEVYDGTVRLDKVPLDQRDHSHEIEASRLSSREAEIVLEADKAMALLRDDGSAVAFPEAVDQMRTDMQQVVQRLSRAKIGQITQSIEEDIIAALGEMIDSLDQALKELERQQQSQAPPSGHAEDPPLVDLLAEIKMIRALQVRVNRRTEQYSKLIEGEQAENPDLLKALDRLADQQRRIYRVTHELEQGKNR